MSNNTTVQKTEKEAGAVSKFIFTSVFVFLIWLAFTSTFALPEVLTGIVVSLVIAYYGYRSFTVRGVANVTPKRVIYMIQYIFVFLWALIKANFNVAKIVLTPSLPINPGIVEFESKLTSDYAKMILANSITLTPGTFTVDLIENRFYIHWLNVEATDPDEVYKLIAEPFEKILLKIYE